MARNNDAPILVMNDDNDLDIMTDEDPTDCAWCLSWQAKRQGKSLQEVMGNGSHGTCETHAEIEYTRYKLSRMGPLVDQVAARPRSHSLYQK